MMRSFKNRDIVSIRSFSPEELVYVIETAKMIKEDRLKKQAAYAHVLEGETIGIAFFEPSTRTRLSFVCAAQALGAHALSFSSTEGTSLLKGESFRHTLQMLSGYQCSLLVVRDSRDGAAQYAADVLDIPVVNGGDGKHEHPTQTMLDLLTIRELFGRLDHLTIGFAGDLKYGRTVRSLQAALQHFPGISFRYISPPQLKPPAEELAALERAHIPYKVSENYESTLPDIDILYVTRIQEERFPDKQEYEKVARSLQLTPDLLLSYAKPSMRILHPLPINSLKFPEIHPAVDDVLVPGTREKYARYIEQAANGLSIRMALLCLLAGKLGTEIREPYELPNYEKKTTLEPVNVTETKQEANRVLGYIENGTVIDHLQPDALFKVIDLLALPRDKLVILGKNFESKKALHGKKGVLKIVDYSPTPNQLNKIAVLSPYATVSYIKNGQVVEKGRVMLPLRIENIMECSNPNCISRTEQKEYAPSVFYTLDTVQRIFQCHYCDTTISEDAVRLR